MLVYDFSNIVPETFRLNVLSCTHFGNLARSKRGIKKAIEDIKSDRRGYWCHLGDATESIHLGDPRYQPVIHEGKGRTVSAQVEDYCEAFAPIAEKLLFQLDGNHEEKIVNTADVADMIAKKFKEAHGIENEIVYGGRTIHATFGPTFKGFFTHGHGVVNSRAEHEDRREFNDCDSIRRRLIRKAADCHVMLQAHIHKLRLKKPQERLNIIVQQKKLKQKYPKLIQSEDGIVGEEYKYFGSTGSFLKTMLVGKRLTTYSEKFNYDPVEMGYLKIHVQRGIVIDIEKIHV